MKQSNGLFRQNSGFSAEQKTLGIRIRTIPRKRKQLDIPFRGIKVEANFHNFVAKPFAEENTLSVMFAGAGNFRFESLVEKAAAKNRCKKRRLLGMDKSFC